ncbi:MAG: dihydrofolate synthase/folylpolyglutamate synthase [Candidatus Paceibacteria bacterium]|jgi:dihydrofolate synthase/folylpolyglutamate synthase
MYQHVGKAAYKIDLSNTLLLADYLGNPQHEFKSIHVAGTNGKGSTSHMMASVLQEAGYKVGLYTSPHLKDFRERIKINGMMIPKRKVSSFVVKHKDFFKNNKLSFFEMTVGLAFHYFAESQVDIAIIEVGLGGRLDSTNIISPELSVITNIGLDHTQFLGTTLEAIAKEKAGIIKSKIPVVIGELHPDTKKVFQQVALENNAPIIYSEEENVSLFDCDLKGNYQKKNQRTALVALKILASKGFSISKTDLEKGCNTVVANTGLLGRWQILQQSPTVICDTAHNKEGLMLTMQQLKQTPYRKLHIVFGVVGDKDLEVILPLLPNSASYYFCAPNIPRALHVAILKQKATDFNLIGASYASVRSAFTAALKMAHTDDLVYIGGSTFVVAEVV